MPTHLATSSTSINISSPSPTSFTLVNHDSLLDTSSDSLTFAELGGKGLEEQLWSLEGLIVKETRIKDGAQNLLNMRLDDDLRQKVLSELKGASSRIKAIMDKKANIELALRNQHKKKEEQIELEMDERGDEFRTALRNARDCIFSLNSLKSEPPDSPDLDRQLIEVMSKLVEILQRNLRVRYELSVPEIVQSVVSALADKRSKQCRAVAYRVIRHSLVDAESIQKLKEQEIEWYIIRSLHRDNKFAVEKEQVIKLIRAIVEAGTMSNGNGPGSVPVSEPVLRAFIAVAEQVDDPFRFICIETLAELVILDTDLVDRAGGIRFLLHAVGEGPAEITPLLASTFLHIIDSPRTRAYLHVGTDLEIVLTAVTDAYGKGPEHAERMKSCTRVIQLMLRTWSGLMYFCMEEMRAIRSLVDTLRLPSLETREVVLNMFFEILNIKSPEWYQTFIAGKRLTTYHRDGFKPELEPSERIVQTLKLTDQYIALLILVFTNVGLIEALVSIMEEVPSGSILSRKATLLIAEILQMANRVLPLSVAARIQAVPSLFSMASSYDDGQQRLVGASALSALDSFNRNRTRLEPGVVKTSSRLRANSVDDAVRRGQRQVEQAKLKLGMQMDDKTFQSSLLDTQVMLTKDHAKWNFDTLQEIIEGPLLHPKRMDEAIKGAHFIRRLMTFFHPFSHRFSDMHRIKVNLRWVRLGCSLLTTLMANQDGIRYLSSEDPFMGQIVKCFAQLDPFNSQGAPDSDPMFSKRRIAETLTYGYLEMLGTLSKHKEGIEILENYKIFTAFYHLSDLKSREDLIKGIIKNLDYSTDGHPRIVLSKALTSSHKRVQVYATQHLGELIRNSPSANSWTLRLLLTQLYDPSVEVRKLAVEYLEEACESKDILEMVVEMRPVMDHLGELGNALLLKFMSTPTGFRYLYDAGYIDREMDIWFEEHNIYYVVQVEVFLAQVLSANEEEEHTLGFEGTVPPHFYGEMAKTELGCQVLQEKGHFGEFAQFIRQHGRESADTELILKLKSVLWAVGNIGATEGGLYFLEEEDIIPVVLSIANESLIPSVRGTCFFVLGLISTTSQGAEILDDYHWEATLTPMGMPTGLCIPVDVDEFLSLPTWKQHIPNEDYAQLIPPNTEPELEALTAIQKLANTVIANAASRSLARMKSRPEYHSVFTSPTMLYRVFHTISTSRYRLPVRRYIMDLFQIELNTEVVAAMVEASKKLKANPLNPPPKTDLNRRLSMFGHLGRRTAESDDDEDDDEMNEDAKPIVPRREVPTIALRPLHKIVGFEC
ncbi:Rapamycin-insensitive companion of mTOR, N-term-domain-containing protein [Lentinula raphanica]|uniref:Rapamycin-insensitive companion of mTOR, N-term-domain-containing protein n=1 Tax=Lentinula raphanica TaxID=153919 RepID=A0AA38P6F3_9AGAR|nr:Rapamycin-insensitive companion of mTOR, N-term-domain-containing protein [Lentinula raphanica]KAJ3837144.1 Rapamycin-insensitive companion of mTOR, N-term-domain-containing protein [Lentinula raphanica]KAJ3973246.1 Rapamycin-insensitive companion of mTOR, N-term-domain-containing protein [Lentinula raphanica]